MDKKYARYMTYGKLVTDEKTGVTYKLIEDMSESRDTVLAVNMDNWRRYELLKAWMQNWEKDKSFRERFTQNIEECAAEKKSYEEAVRIKKVSPVNSIRFIYPDYTEKFQILNFGKVMVDGSERTAYYIDDYHFGFIGGCVYHICEFAEICERSGKKVKMVS